MTSVNDLTALIAKRTVCKQKFTRLSNQTNFDLRNITHFETQLKRLEPLQEEYIDIDSNIQSINEESADSLYADNMYNIICKLYEKIEELKSNNVKSSPSSNFPNINLPKLTLPNFNGDYIKWTSFHDTFLSLIHNSKALSIIEKFHYLKASLIGEAADLIKSLDLSEVNYDIAWKSIIDRYDNKKQIVKNHTRALLTLNNITKVNLRESLNTIMENIRALIACNLPVSEWDTLIIAIITIRFDHKLNEEWETTTANVVFPKFEQLKEFLERKCKVLEAIDETLSFNKNKFVKREIKKSFMSTANTIKCNMCSGNHKIFACSKFIKLNAQGRFEFCKSKNLCINCLRDDHKVSNCTSSSCKHCNLKHNTMLHFERTSSKTKVEQEEINKSTENLDSNKLNLHVTVNSHVLLSTAVVYVKDKDGKKQSCRAILDSGSQSNFITSNLAEKLKLEPLKINIPIVGINNTRRTISSSMNIEVLSRFSNFKFSSNFLILQHISNKLPEISIPNNSIKISKNLSLADPQFNVPKEVDMLIGAEMFYSLLKSDRIVNKGQPTLQDTKLGWIISGIINTNYNMSQSICNFAEVQLQLEKFWNVEEIDDNSIHNNFTQDEIYCEEHFNKTYERNNDGRFVVKLPFKSNIENLGDSKVTALNRFKSLERKFIKDNSLKTDYTNFMLEYLNLNHMKRVDKPDNNNTKCYYLPHHAVIKDSTTTKLRVVFDASAPTTTGHSLNDYMYAGPTIQQSLFSLLIRFRTYKYALTADIAKMYRQVLVTPEQTSLQRILWRQEATKNIDTYELTTITYGTKSAPYLAIKCLHKLAELEHNNHPIGAETTLRDFYVDDMITGTNTIEDAINLKNDIDALLNKGCFELRKWASNEPQILSNIENNQIENKIIKFDNDTSIKTLGIAWHPPSDCFKFAYFNQAVKNKLTKRIILSDISKIFDPLGIISPILIQGKLLMQCLWARQLNWDDQVPHDIHESWIKILNDLRSLSNIKISRNVMCSPPFTKIELHGFADASTKAYGACIYIRSFNSDNTISCNLLCSKTRVAPIKQITIPRLELCAALLLAKLFKQVINFINLKFDKIHLWSDSTIVLAWIQSESKSFKTFVQNRISQIQALTCIKDWNHVNSSDNPADILSRGSNTESLKKNNLWWHGPQWLSRDIQWPNSINEHITNLPEQKMVHFVTQRLPSDIFNSFSNYTKMLRVLSYCRRFSYNCKNKLKVRNAFLTTKEIVDTEICLIKIVQVEHFSNELQQLTNNKHIHKSSKLLKLSPFVNDNIIRVGGRLLHSELNYSQKFPIILPPNHIFTTLLIKHVHEVNFHAGPLATISMLRDKFWIVNARNRVRHVLHNCITCFKVNPISNSYKMGNLPKERLTMSRPFSVCSVDYGGPILIKDANSRSTKRTKAYIAVFVCMSTKAVHIELITNLTTAAFIAALKRLMGRRGKISHMFSDNATNFRGAAHELHELFKFFKNQTNVNQLIDVAATNNVQWHFIPPNAPNFGGLWEAGIKSVKSYLKKVAKNAALTYEQLYTLLVQIEAILNSRPLTPISSDPSELEPLTPSHFLIGDTMTSTVEPDITAIKQNRLSIWQHIEQMRQHFWRRWSIEYVTSLQERTKWFDNNKRSIKINDLVIVKEDNLPPLQWALGRVVELHPGSDDVTRVVTIKTSKGIFKRPVTKICVLPKED